MTFAFNVKLAETEISVVGALWYWLSLVKLRDEDQGSVTILPELVKLAMAIDI